MQIVFLGLPSHNLNLPHLGHSSIVLALLQQLDNLVLKRSDLKLMNENLLVVLLQLLYQFEYSRFIFQVLLFLVE